MRAKLMFGMAAIALFLLSACSNEPITGTPGGKQALAVPAGSDRPTWPRADSTWTVPQVSTGSFGDAAETIRSRALGPRDGAGPKVMAVEAGENVWYFDDEKRAVAQMRGGKLVATYEPGEAVYDWPLAVGKAWTAKYRYLNHATGQATDVEFEVRVESYERVDTSAGSFDTYRISMTSPTAKLIRWYSPKLGILVKDR